MHFIDEVKIFLQSGTGGNGCVAFRREKFIPHGGPNGGDGGKGGDIIFETVDNLNTLIDFRYKQHFKARPGDGGRGQNCNGKSADDLVIKVPVGTCIYAEDRKTIIKDLSQPGERYVFLKGGDGGFGNAHFKTSTNQTPRKFIPGFPGEEDWVWLKLKLLSDAGVIGLPNAGKSTFLSVVTSATPKIADYPFTTLIPQLGVVYIDDTEFVLADIPGLIEGAHQGVGLGDRFLKHVERCRVLLHLIDGNSDDLLRDYKIVRTEMEAFNPDILKKKEIIAISKIDSLTEEELKDKIKQLKSLKKPIMTISSISRTNVDKVVRELNKVVKGEDFDDGF